MPKQHLKTVLQKLPGQKKFIAGGALVIVLSLFFPWYRDLDNFSSGEIYTGLSGPLSMIGITFFLLAGFSIFAVFMEYFEKKIPFHFGSRKMYLGIGILNFYLLFLVNSIYFDSHFGVNITLKQSDFGMFLAFIGTSLYTIGGYLESRDKTNLLKEFQEETNPSIEVMPNISQDKPREGLKTNLNHQNKIRTAEVPGLAKESQKKTQPFRMDL